MDNPLPARVGYEWTLIERAHTVTLVHDLELERHGDRVLGARAGAVFPPLQHVDRVGPCRRSPWPDLAFELRPCTYLCCRPHWPRVKGVMAFASR